MFEICGLIGAVESQGTAGLAGGCCSRPTVQAVTRTGRQRPEKQSVRIGAGSTNG